MPKVSRPKGAAKPCTLALAELTFDQSVQQRETLNDATIERYAERMRDGDAFDPLVAFFDGSTHWVADGFHRGEAARRAEIATVAVDVRPGSKRDAVLYSTSANRNHGLPMSNSDKRKAVRSLLDDPEWAKWSDRKIAKHVGVSQPFVSKLRKGDNGYHPEPDRLTHQFGLPELDGIKSYGGLALAANPNAGDGAGFIFLVPYERDPAYYWIEMQSAWSDTLAHTKKPMHKSGLALMLDVMMTDEGWSIEPDIRWIPAGKMRVVETDTATKVQTGNWFGHIDDSAQA